MSNNIKKRKAREYIIINNRGQPLFTKFICCIYNSMVALRETI